MGLTFWTDRPVLVTGATGLLGGWLVDGLLRHGAQVVCLIRDWTPSSRLLSEGALSQVTVARGDVREQSTVERVLGEYEIDTVIHLAAQAIVDVAHRNPLSSFETNIGGTWCVLDACRRSPAVRQIVIASSDKAYGDHGSDAYDEEMSLRARHPYDVSKACADLIAQSFAATYQLPVAITRCGNLFGGGDFNWSRLIPGTIRSIYRGIAPTIRSNGQYARDYIYVEDAADAYILLAEKLADNPDLRGNAFNFSYELHMTVLDVVTRIKELMGSELSPEIRNTAQNEIVSQHLVSTKARQQLDWAPRLSFDVGLERTVRWYEKYFNYLDGQRVIP